MTDSRVLALDLGSSSVRAVVLAREGAALRPVPGATRRAAASIRQDPSGAAELDLPGYLAGVLRCLDELSDAGMLAGVGTIAASTQWHTLVGLDAHGAPAGPCLSWMDLRPTLPGGVSPADTADFHRRTGAWWHPFYWPVRIGWLRGRGVRAARWVGLPEYLGLTLWGEPTASVSSASGTGALDTLACRWDDEALSLAGVTAGEVPPLAPDDWSGRLTAEYRKRWPDLADARIAVPLGDGAASSVGTGCVDGTRLSVTVGTSAAVRLVTDGDTATLPDRVFRYRLDRRKAVLGIAFSGGGVLEKWLERVVTGPITDEALSTLPPAGHGLVALPFHAGHRPPDPAVGAGGTLHGLRLTTGPIDIAAATLEGAVHEISLGAETIDPAGAAMPVLGGGAIAASGWLNRRLAAGLGGTALRCTNAEVGARGAAATALWAAGATGLDELPEHDTVRVPDAEVAAMTAARHRHRELADRLGRPDAP